MNLNLERNKKCNVVGFGELSKVDTQRLLLLYQSVLKHEAILLYYFLISQTTSRTREATIPWGSITALFDNSLIDDLLNKLIKCKLIQFEESEYINSVKIIVLKPLPEKDFFSKILNRNNSLNEDSKIFNLVSVISENLRSSKLPSSWLEEFNYYVKKQKLKTTVIENYLERIMKFSDLYKINGADAGKALKPILSSMQSVNLEHILERIRTFSNWNSINSYNSKLRNLLEKDIDLKNKKMKNLEIEYLNPTVYFEVIKNAIPSTLELSLIEKIWFTNKLEKPVVNCLIEYVWRKNGTLTKNYLFKIAKTLANRKIQTASEAMQHFRLAWKPPSPVDKPKVSKTNPKPAPFSQISTMQAFEDVF